MGYGMGLEEYRNGDVEMGWVKYEMESEGKIS